MSLNKSSLVGRLPGEINTSLLAKDKLLILHRDLIELIAYFIDGRMSQYDTVTQGFIRAPYYYQDLVLGKWGGALLDEVTYIQLNQFDQLFKQFLDECPLHFYDAIAFSQPKYSAIRYKLILVLRNLEADFELKGVNGFVSYREFEYELLPLESTVRNKLILIKEDLLIKPNPDPALLNAINLKLAAYEKTTSLG